MHRLALRKGWTTFWLVALVVFTATWSVQLADWADGLQILTTVTILGLIIGLVLAHLERIPAVLAHLVALAAGTVIVLYQMTGFLSDNLGSRRDRLDYLWTRWEQWYQAVSRGERADDLYLFILLMAALLWVVSYISVWFVFRSHWVWLTLLLPAVILLLNMGYSRRVPHAILVLYLFAAILLLMRFTLAERERIWKRAGIPYPETLIWRGFWVASYLAVAVIVIGWLLPLSTQSERMLTGWERINGPWRQVESTFNNWFSSLRGPGGIGVGGFATFGDKFELGGPLRLSNQPVVVVRGDSAPYLVAHRYNIFTGRGWESDLDQTFEPPAGTSARQVSPLLEFAADQRIPLPASATQKRTPEEYEIEILQPRGAIVYSAEDASQVSVPTQMQVAWYTYEDQQLDVQAATEETTPPDLWPLVSVLKEADLTPPPPQPTPTPTPTPVATPGAEATPAASDATPGAEEPSATPGAPLTSAPSEEEIRYRRQLMALREEQRRLRDRGIATNFDVGPDHRVTSLTFSGQLPVFADIEAIFASQGVRTGQTYEVQSLVSEATVDELRNAGTAYPVEITSRYLQLPEVSQRTRELANELAQGQSNPYDIASAIETYLRANLRYNENVPNPPPNRDLVDYFLFDSRQGYCTYYASAMAEMLRILDIPSRVAVGFYPADFDSGVGGYLYRDLNAHAWVEVYFPGYGWIPFEPTAARSQIQRPTPNSETSSSSSSSASSGLGILPQDRLGMLEEDIPPGGFGSIGALPTEDGTSRTEWAVRGLVALVLAGIAIVAYLWLRGLRGLTPVTQFFTKVQRGAGWGGVPVHSSMTPYEYASTIAEHVPGSRTHVRLLADLYVRERYGRQPATPGELTRARSAWLRLRGMLLRHLLVRRWRRRLSSRSGDDD